MPEIEFRSYEAEKILRDLRRGRKAYIITCTADRVEITHKRVVVDIRQLGKESIDALRRHIEIDQILLEHSTGKRQIETREPVERIGKHARYAGRSEPREWVRHVRRIGVV